MELREDRLLPSPLPQLTLPAAPVDVPRLLASRRIQKEVLSDDELSELTSAPLPEASVASVTITKKVSAAIAVERQYTGMVLDNVTPVNLVRFWMARRDYSRLNGQEPIIAAVSDVVSSLLERTPTVLPIQLSGGLSGLFVN